MIKHALLCLSLWLSLSMPLTSVQACTTFAAHGKDYVSDAGTLIVKVRDEFMTGQVVKTVRPDKGYAYTGLFTGKRQTFNMGINEKGFVVFRTTAGSVPKEIRRQAKRFKSPERLAGQEFLIRYSASVEEALSHAEVFRHEPTHYIMADRHEIAFVEVFPDGRYSVTRRRNDMLAHTNHYLSEAGQSHNRRIGRSSRTRLERIQTLLSTSDKPFDLDDFIGFAHDRNDGPHNSIFRVHDDEKRQSTLSVLAVHIPKSGSPELYLKWRDSRSDRTSWKQSRTVVRFAP